MAACAALLGSREAASADGDVPTTALDLAVELMTSKQITARIITKSQRAEEVHGSDGTDAHCVRWTCAMCMRMLTSEILNHNWPRATIEPTSPEPYVTLMLTSLGPYVTLMFTIAGHM